MKTLPDGTVTFGRPALPPEEKLEVLTIRLKAGQRRRLEAEARARGVSVSVLLRELVDQALPPRK